MGLTEARLEAQRYWYNKYDSNRCDSFRQRTQNMPSSLNIRNIKSRSKDRVKTIDNIPVSNDRGCCHQADHAQERINDLDSEKKNESDFEYNYSEMLMSPPLRALNFGW